MTRIYLAGKMADLTPSDCNCGADSIDIRHMAQPVHDDECSSWKEERSHWRENVGAHRPAEGRPTALPGGFVFGGPWFLDWGEHGSDRHHIPSRCFEWILQSEGVFTWLGTDDAHGTLIEVGYAKAIGKPLFIAVDTSGTGELRRILWFAEHVGDGFAALPDVTSAWVVFTRWWRAGRTANVPSYGIRFR